MYNNLTSIEKLQVNEKIREWGIPISENEYIHKWFDNYVETDSALSLKIFFKIEYLNYKEFKRRLQTNYNKVIEYLNDNNLNEEDLLIILPNNITDSATRHAYDEIKTWGLNTNQFVQLKDLYKKKIENKVALIFNDTQGTGNQFEREIWNPISKFEFKKIICLSIQVSSIAFNRFKEISDKIISFPKINCKTIYDEFSIDEIERIEILGKKVYPMFPLGYGNIGLLCAYYFQCPNNTIPIIWADGTNNKSSDTPAIAWNPLFPYFPKKRQKLYIIKDSFKTIKFEKIEDENNLLNDAFTWVKEINKLSEREIDIKLRNVKENIERQYLNKGNPIEIYDKVIENINKLDNLLEYSSNNLGQIHNLLSKILINSALNFETITRAREHAQIGVKIFENTNQFNDWIILNLIQSKWLYSLSFHMQGQANISFEHLDRSIKDVEKYSSEEQRLYLLRQKMIIESDISGYKFLERKKELYISDEKECFYTYKRMYEFHIKIDNLKEAERFYHVCMKYFPKIENKLEKVYIYSFKKLRLLQLVKSNNFFEAKALCKSLINEVTILDLIGQKNGLEKLQRDYSLL